MHTLKRFLTVAGIAMMMMSTPISGWAEAANADPASTKTETEALQQEVAELKNRLARLENMLVTMGAQAVQDALSSTPGTGEVQLMNATFPASPVSSLAAPAPAPQASALQGGAVPDGVASTGGQPLSITGILDAYYTKNFNNPASGENTLYYTNPNSRGFGLNQAKLEIDAFGDGPVGFRSDIWFGSGARLFRDGLEPGDLRDVLYLQQAYGYYQWDNGAELDVGLFGTIAGLEVAESHLNWNYTRGILWAWNEPFSHMGAKLSTPLSDTFTSTVMLVNGFDNAFDQNSGKTYGLQGSWAPNDRFNTTVTWIHGPENGLGEDGWQKDLSWNFYAGLHEKFEVMVNFDGIWNENDDSSTQRSWGLGGYARFTPADKFAISQRFEYFDDTEARSTGVEHILKEYTLTFEYAPEPRFITRFEYRRDWSTTPFFFSRGLTGSNDSQGTLTLGMMWVFGPVE